MSKKQRSTFAHEFMVRAQTKHRELGHREHSWIHCREPVCAKTNAKCDELFTHPSNRLSNHGRWHAEELVTRAEVFGEGDKVLVDLGI